MERSFERAYALNVARMRQGKTYEESFKVGRSFFEEFEQSLIQDGNLTVSLDIKRNIDNLVVTFHLQGTVKLPCDRCNIEYDQPVDEKQRLIYSFDKQVEGDDLEVVHVDPSEPYLVLVQDIYDFINLAVPFRKVPPADIHLCDPEVLDLLGLDENGQPKETEETDKEIDPRWEALKKLKEKK